MNSSPANLFEWHAVAIGRHLVAAAVWSGDRCNWTGDEVEGTGDHIRVVHRSLDGALYNGTSGIARFLGHLWRRMRDETVRSTALGAMRRAEALAMAEPTPNLWTGALGTACAAVELGQVLGDPAMAARGVAAGARIAAAVSADSVNDTPALDLVDGLAGTLVGLAYVARRSPDLSIGVALTHVAEGLLKKARRRPAGWSWPYDERHATGVDWCGLAHGGSGIALALVEAYERLGDARLEYAAREAARYERAWFHRESSNWPDLRDHGHGSPPVLHPVYWCHGAAGIGLARLRHHQLTCDAGALADVTAALHAVARNPPVDNLSVCHGIGSAIELLLFAHDVLGTPGCLHWARAAGAQALSAAAQRGTWACGVRDGGSHPGAMLGLAGMGMWCLRLADPASVPPATMWV